MSRVLPNDSPCVKVSKIVGNMIAKLEKAGFTNEAYFKAKFVSPDLIQKGWELLDRIDAEYLRRGEALKDTKAWDDFSEEIVVPCFWAWQEVTDSVKK